MTLLALTRLTFEMKSPQKQNQNRKGATASAGGFMVLCFSLPDPNPTSPLILAGKVTGATFLPSHRTASQWSQENVGRGQGNATK